MYVGHDTVKESEVPSHKAARVRTHDVTQEEMKVLKSIHFFREVRQAAVLCGFA